MDFFGSLSLPGRFWEKGASFPRVLWHNAAFSHDSNESYDESHPSSDGEVLDFSWLMILSEGVQVNGYCLNDQMFSLFYNIRSGINGTIINEIYNWIHFIIFLLSF